MIGDGLFQAQLSTVQKILKKLNLLEERNISPNKEISAADFKGLNYRQIYEECLKEFFYDFRLSDQSLLLFTKGGRNENNGYLNFCYYECPINLISYIEFVAQEFGLSMFDEELDREIAVWGDFLRGDYEQYVSSMEFKKTVTPIRYDYKATDYREGIHPASHIHIGFANEIRICTQRIMNPISFVLLILRQRYPREWERLLGLEDHPTWCRNVRGSIDLVSEEYFKGFDFLEMFMH